MLAVAAMASQGLALSAAEPQDARQREPREQRQPRRVVISHEVVMDLQEIHHTLDQVIRELPQVMPSGMLDDLRTQERDYRAEQVDKQTKTLAIGPSGSLELRNIVGDIIVKAGGLPRRDD
jgi:small-conductance mechanosensitive channel